VPLVEQELPTLSEHLSSPQVFRGVRVSSIWVRTKPYLRGCCGGCYRKSHDRKWRQSRAMSGSMFCACATGNCAALVGPFDRKWQSHVTGSGPVRKRSRPEVCSAHAPFFHAFFFLVVVTWLLDVTEGHLTPFGFSWWPLQKCHCGVLYDVRVL
jgi:hypothetical protein